MTDNEMHKMLCLSGLKTAVDDPALSVFDDGGGVCTEENRRAAYWLATAIGECRIFGVCIDELWKKGVLPTQMAKAAGEYLHQRVNELVADMAQLPAIFDAADNSIEAEELCLNPVEERLKFWATSVALEEAFIAALDGGTAESSGLAAVYSQTLSALQSLDQAMQEQTPLLAVAADTELLQNWRHCAVNFHRLTVPWVLDGTLDRAAVELEAKALATIPDRKHI